MLNSKFLAFNTPNTKNSVTSDISNLKKKKIDMGLQCCSKNETIRSKMLKIFFIFYSLSLLSTDSQLSVSLSILSLSLSSLFGDGFLVAVHGRSYGLSAVICGSSTVVQSSGFRLFQR